MIRNGAIISVTVSAFFRPSLANTANSLKIEIDRPETDVSGRFANWRLFLALELFAHLVDRVLRIELTIQGRNDEVLRCFVDRSRDAGERRDRIVGGRIGELRIGGVRLKRLEFRAVGYGL